MPIVRLSGTVTGTEDPRRKERAELLFHLFAEGWDIYNGNGDQRIRLDNIQEKILESDAFVYTGKPSLEDYFNLTSIFVGFQTLDLDLKGKPAVMMNADGSWDNFLAIMDRLHALGTVKEPYSQYLKVVKSKDELLSILGRRWDKVDPRAPKVRAEPDIYEKAVISEKQIKMPKFNVCVFCSASISKQDYLDEGYAVGKMLAERDWGCISGAGKTGIMGQVVKGAYQNNGWSGGSNVPHIIQLEGLPEGLNEFWPRADIYTRMEIMIEKSDAFVVMPGGMGTLQELFAMLILRNHGDDLMKGKPIVVFNKTDPQTGLRFWDPVIELLKGHEAFMDEFVAVESVEEIFEHLGRKC